MDQAQAKQRLLDLKQELVERIDAIERDIRHEGMTADWTEQASERENDQVLEALGNSSEDELAMVKTALKRIEDGSYFFCEQCGSEIPAARLELLPFTSRCINCAE